MAVYPGRCGGRIETGARQVGGPFILLEHKHIDPGEKPEKVLSIFIDALTDDRKSEVFCFLAEEALQSRVESFMKSAAVRRRLKEIAEDP